MFQQVILLGRLTKDVELRMTSNNKAVASASLVTSKNVKVNEKWEERAEFHNLVIWQGAENFAKYLKKGSKVQVIGELRTDMYEKDGQKHYPTKIIVNQFFFLDSPKSEPKKEEQEENPFKEDINEDDNFNHPNGTFRDEEVEEEIRAENIPF